MKAEVVSRGMYSPVRSQELCFREEKSDSIRATGSINLTTGLEDQFEDFDLTNVDETGDGGSVSTVLFYSCIFGLPQRSFFESVLSSSAPCYIILVHIFRVKILHSRLVF